MVDVTATPVGSQATTITLVDGVYIIDKTSPFAYGVILNRGENNPPPPPGEITVTGVGPASAEVDTNPAFFISGTGFVSVGVSQINVWIEGYPEIQEPISWDSVTETEIVILHGGVAAATNLVSMIGVPLPYQIYFRVIGMDSTEHDTPPWTLNPLLPAEWGITSVGPQPFSPGTDPSVTVTGFGFNAWGVLFGSIFPMDDAIVGSPLSFTIEDDNTITIASGMIPAFEAIGGDLLSCQLRMTAGGYETVASPLFNIADPIWVGAQYYPEQPSPAGYQTVSWCGRNLPAVDVGAGVTFNHTINPSMGPVRDSTFAVWIDFDGLGNQPAAEPGQAPDLAFLYNNDGLVFALRVWGVDDTAGVPNTIFIQFPNGPPGTDFSYTFPGGPAPSGWHLIVVSVGTDTLAEAWVDGFAATVDSAPQAFSLFSPETATANMVNNRNLPADGRTGGVAIYWDRILTSDERTRLANEFTPPV